MKLRSAAALILLILFIDQALKIWIKTNFSYGLVTNVGGLKWFQIYFIENEGMAWGLKLGGDSGKLLLTVFRLAAVIFGTWYLGRIVKQRYTKGFIICACLIYAGALGNLLDSIFYGLIFSSSDYNTVATMFPAQGYAGLFHGKVVDMLYFPIVKSTYPEWIPFLGGKKFEFFSPIFNVADASISIGVITLLVFQKRYIRRMERRETHPTVETATESTDTAHIM
jgi:signal peptidase II